ncbi:zinc finger protein 454-like isoform X3 [Pangasianodon hypophthalmus]|uniref:zinc finger protein 454-like isoform X3 n=1 Tax=Pangasianodon hypophthalmus TaxID=310915 RepID=UPI00230709CB|nr:zinc finger protein 454-like isoform X3 [Pangasianodon hypophthalmus]
MPNHPGKMSETEIRQEVSSEKENAPASATTCSEVEESSWLKAFKSVQTPEGSNILQSREVLVNTQHLLDLFQVCWLCHNKCCITIRCNKRLFSVTQNCQNCGYHREWKSQPPSAEPAQTFHNQEASSEKENAPTPVSACSEVEESSWLKVFKSLQTPQGFTNLQRSEVLVNTQCLLKLFQFCWLGHKECCIAIKGNERLLSVTQDCQSCGYHRDWRSRSPTGLTSDDEEEEDSKKKRKRSSKRKHSSDEWEPCLDEVAKESVVTDSTDSDVSMDEDLFTALKEDGQGKLVVWCTQCGTEASLSCSVHRHKKVFCCAQCSEGDDIQAHTFETLRIRFDDVGSFQKHAEQEHGAKPFYILCQDCGKFVIADPESRGLKEHKCEHKSKFIICPECGKRFLTKVGLKSHYTQLHSDYDHPCKYCLKVFKTRSIKLEHEQTHPKEKQPYSCSKCPKRFSNIYKRNRHVRSHGGPQKHVCDVCKKNFKDIYKLRRHKLIHSGEQPFKCQVCERSFNQMENLTSHMRIHTGEKPFMCEQCGESFSHNVSLKNHKQRHHDSGGRSDE